MRFSANLGFLWTELSLPDAIRAAKSAGFQAVECHWPYDVPAQDVADALHETGLPMLGLNTTRGDPGENGLSALPGRGADARAAVDQALAYAAATDTGAVHVMAGFAQGAAAHAAFVDTLRYACDRSDGRTILIEPLNHYDAPDYFLRTTTQAEAIIAEVGAPNLKLMQVASVPDRGAPDHGELHYGHVWDVLARLGWDAPVGAEYKPNGPTEPTLGWM